MLQLAGTMSRQRQRSANLTTPLAEARTEARRAPPRDSRLGSYAVLAPLARGGTSGVYLAEHSTTHQRVAIKVLDPFYADHPELVERLFGERTVSATCRHNGLVDVLVADRSPTGVPYVVMEYLDGENLGTLADRGRIELDAVLAIGAQVAAALCAMHDAGVAHCDVKLHNVFVLYQTGLDGWPRIKVIDYGVARRFDEPHQPDAGIAGTPACMPPEQWRGAPTAKSDVYALGCLLYELLTGNQVFQGTLPALMTAHCERLADRASQHRSDVPPALDEMIARALSKDPGMRPTMADFEDGLLWLLRRDQPELRAAG